VEGGFLDILELGSEFARWCAGFMERYQDMGVQMADAALVYLAERENVDTVFTLDRRDFAVYRTRRKRVLNIIP
jgi:predicted nucleic acid-binding protein